MSIEFYRAIVTIFRGRVMVGIHGLSRSEFDRIPGKARRVTGASEPTWMKTYSKTRFFTIEPRGK